MQPQRFVCTDRADQNLGFQPAVAAAEKTFGQAALQSGEVRHGRAP